MEGIEYDSKFVFEEIGYQLEPSEISAAFALIQLKKLSENTLRRREVFNEHTKFLSEYTNWLSLPKQTESSETGWLAYPLVINMEAPFSRRDLQIFLENRNIQTRVVFTGNILRQPMCQNISKKVLEEGYPNADRVMARGVLLPLHHGMTESMFNRLHATIHKFTEQYD